MRAMVWSSMFSALIRPSRMWNLSSAFLRSNWVLRVTTLRLWPMYWSMSCLRPRSFGTSLPLASFTRARLMMP